MNEPEVAAAELIHQLENSNLINGELGTYTRVSMAEFADLTNEQRAERGRVQTEAIRQVDFRYWQGVIGRLIANPGAVPVLIDLWRRCPVLPLRQDAGSALFTIGTDTARAALRETLYSADQFDRSLALQVMFTDDGASWDNVGFLFNDESLSLPGASRLAGEALNLLAPYTYPDEVPGWRIPELEGELDRDDRWFRLCASLRRDRFLGEFARYALRFADRASTVLKLRTLNSTPKTPPTPGPLLSDPLLRYNNDPAGCWQELRGWGELNTDQRAQANVVAQETMRRVKANAQRLVAALIGAGWPITAETALPGPPADLENHLAQLERLTGQPLPPALDAFFRIVGTIDLVPENLTNLGSAPGLLVELDPLQILDPVQCWYGVEEWQEDVADLEAELRGPIPLNVSADHLHKANISGGAPYSLWLPDAGADPILQEEPHDLAFTDYLRYLLGQKGFALLNERGDVPARAWVEDIQVEFGPF